MNATRFKKLASLTACCLAWMGIGAASAFAQIGPQPLLPDTYPNWSSCQEMMDACKETDAETIYDAALLASWSGMPSVQIGTCYAHDKTTCPTCSCNNYIKQTWRSGAKGYDGGTGCVGPNNDPVLSRAAAAAILKQMCETGACCCPQVEAKPCPNPNPVRRCGDAIGQTCCTFPNECSAPGAAQGWFPG